MDLSDLHKKSDADNSNTDLADPNEEWANKASSPALEELQKKYQELEDQYKRIWADHQNMLNRFNRERQESAKYAAFNTIQVILPALDNFDFARKSINENTSYSDIVKSINMLQEQLIMNLKSVGLEEIDTNCVYNPELHEAVTNVKSEDKAEGTILEVLKKGYKLNDKVLRVATVIVSSKE